MAQQHVGSRALHCNSTLLALLVYLFALPATSVLVIGLLRMGWVVAGGATILLPVLYLHWLPQTATGKDITMSTFPCLFVCGISGIHARAADGQS